MAGDHAEFEKQVRYVGARARTFSRGISRKHPQNISETARISLLKRLLPFSESELRDYSRQSKQKIMARLRAALRRERVQGRAGHWAYDLNRHIALSQALRSETKRQPQPQGTTQVTNK